MKVITFSRIFPAGHPKAGQPTHFVEKIWQGLDNGMPALPGDLLFDEQYRYLRNDFVPKLHTIRTGARYKPGDMASLRVWSGLPYRSKQIEFARVEVKKVWQVEIRIHQTSPVMLLDGDRLTFDAVKMIAENDGLSVVDFISWFNMHPKKKQQIFTGQVICWSDKINY